MQRCLRARLGTGLPMLWGCSQQVKHSAKKASSGLAWSLLGGGQLRVSLGISFLSCYVLAFCAHNNLLSAMGWSVWTRPGIHMYLSHTELFSSCRTGIFRLGHLRSWLRQREQILHGE